MGRRPTLPLVQTLIICLLILGASGRFLSVAAARPSDMLASSEESQRWREDLRYLSRMLQQVHKNAFHKVSRQDFETAVRKLDEQIPTLSRQRIIVELQRIVALVGDGHTRIELYSDPKVAFHRYPIRFYFFKDGLFVRSAAREYAD